MTKTGKNSKTGAVCNDVPLLEACYFVRNASMVFILALVDIFRTPLRHRSPVPLLSSVYRGEMLYPKLETRQNTTGQLIVYFVDIFRRGECTISTEMKTTLCTNGVGVGVLAHPTPATLYSTATSPANAPWCRTRPCRTMPCVESHAAKYISLSKAVLFAASDFPFHGFMACGRTAMAQCAQVCVDAGAWRGRAGVRRGVPPEARRCDGAQRGVTQLCCSL